jgi:hypothetical protein
MCLTPGGVKAKTIKISICCFSARHPVFKRKSKDWLDRNQYNLSDIFIRILPEVVIDGH